jgi:hypothetical protein
MCRMIPVLRGPRALVGLNRLWHVGFSALLALLLAACGPAATNNGNAASASTTPKVIPGAAVVIRPCDGSYTGGYTPALTLSNTSSNVTGSAHTGDTIEIRMKGQYYWRLASVKPASALALTYQGALANSGNTTCVWIFHASAPGNATVTFTGTTICDPTKTCSQHTITYNFAIHIS